MMNKTAAAVIYIVLVVIGLLLSFFVVFNFMFSDSGSLLERAFTFGITAVAYGIVGAITAFLRPNAWRMVAVLLVLPALAVTLLYSYRERESLWLNLIYFIVAAAFTFLGAYLASRVSRLKR